MHQHKQTNIQSGFTLIELLIVVGIVAILMAVAYPSYRTFIQRSHAAQLQETLMTTSARLERQMATSANFPVAAPAMENTNRFAFSYSTGADARSYVLTGLESGMAVWAGVNSLGTRCSCTTCATAPTFTGLATSCPTNTQAF